MGYISLGIHESFKSERERTWLKVHCTVQRALPIADIPSIHAAFELALS